MKFQYELEDINHDYMILWCNLAKKTITLFFIEFKTQSIF